MESEFVRLRRTSRTLLGFVFFAGGCDRDDGPKVYPVSGKVLVDGKPAAKALITFHPSSGPSTSTIPFAETDADGSFHISTRMTGDGAPAGNYTLTILWPESKIDRGEEISGQDRLGGRYSHLQNSSVKVTVKEGENSLPPLELRSSALLPARGSSPAVRNH